MEQDASSLSMTPELVATLVGRGVGTDEVVRLLVATGAWSEAGATEIVSALALPASDSASAHQGWPGPPDDAPPLFAA